MGERPGILRELAGAQAAHVLDPLHRRRSLVGGEALVAIDGEAFLQRKLEPVATGDAVAGPVVEIFVRHHGGDRIVIVIGRGVGIGEDVAAVEDVQPLVLHRPEIEIVHRDDVEHVEIIFAAIDALVPRHRRPERVERVIGARQVGGAHPDAQRHLAPRLRDERAAIDREIARHQREQIGRFRERIVPFRPVAPVGEVARRDRIAVRQQHGETRFVRRHLHAIGGEHVRPVGKIGDAAEALRLALRAQDAARRI